MSEEQRLSGKRHPGPADGQGESRGNNAAQEPKRAVQTDPERANRRNSRRYSEEGKADRSQCERPETGVTVRTGHMGYTFWFFPEAGGVDAVEGVFGDGRAPAVCRTASRR